MTCGGWPGGGKITADDLNKLIPYQSVYFGGQTIRGAWHQPTTSKKLQVGTQQQGIFTQQFLKTKNTECNFYWQFRNHPIDYSDPQLKIAPQFLQIDVDKPEPEQFAFFEFSIGVSYNGTTIDYTLEGPPEVRAQCLIPGKWENFLVGPAGDKAKRIPELFGDGALNTGKFNFLAFEIERWKNNEQDTFPEDVYLLGAEIQYKTDFNNVSEWPSI